MIANEIEADLKQFMVDNFLFGDAAAAPARDQPLVQSGLVDSTGILEIVAFLESKFGVQAADEELAAENFATISTIAKFVIAKRG